MTRVIFTLAGLALVALLAIDANAQSSDVKRDRFHCSSGMRDDCAPPPAEDRVWSIGQPLPDAVMYYPVAVRIVETFPAVPEDQVYADVGGDILLLNSETRIVVLHVDTVVNALERLENAPDGD